MHSLRRYDWVFHLATIFLCTYFLANSFVIFLTSRFNSSSVSTSSSSSTPAISPLREDSKMMKEFNIDDFKTITARNIFNSAEVILEKNSEESTDMAQQVGELGPAVATTLDVKLLGTLVVGEGTDRRSSAVIQGGPDNKGVSTFFVSDQESFGKNIRITKVTKDRVEFVNGNKLEFKELEGISSKNNFFASAEEVHGKGLPKPSEKSQKEPSPSSEGGRIVVDQKKIDEALQNLDKLQSEVRIFPNYADNKLNGMKVLSVKPGSVVNDLGIKRGDILQKVNGQDLDLQRGLELFNSMKDLKNFSLDISRGGKSQTLEYEIR